MAHLRGHKHRRFGVRVCVLTACLTSQRLTCPVMFRTPTITQGVVVDAVDAAVHNAEAFCTTQRRVIRARPPHCGVCGGVTGVKMKVLESQRSSNYVRRDMRWDSATENEKKPESKDSRRRRPLIPPLGSLFSFFLQAATGFVALSSEKRGKKNVAGRGAAARPLDPPPPTVPHRPWPSVARSASLVPRDGVL